MFHIRIFCNEMPLTRHLDRSESSPNFDCLLVNKSRSDGVIVSFDTITLKNS